MLLANKGFVPGSNGSGCGCFGLDGVDGSAELASNGPCTSNSVPSTFGFLDGSSFSSSSLESNPDFLAEKSQSFLTSSGVKIKFGF